MRLLIALIQVVAGVLSGPDPAQMEKAPDLGYRPVPAGLTMPEGTKIGASSSVAIDKRGHLIVFNRGEHPLMEFDAAGRVRPFVRRGAVRRPHGMRIDPEGNIWTTDVNGHTVTKMSAVWRRVADAGHQGQPGKWDEAAGTRLCSKSRTTSASDPSGDVFVVEGHGRGEPGVSAFRQERQAAQVVGRQWQGAWPVRSAALRGRSTRKARCTWPIARIGASRCSTLDGAFVKEWTFAGLPCGLYVAADGQMYLASGFAGQILRLDANGKAVAAMGQPGKALGEFGEAHYLTIAPGGDIYVADTINATLHKYVKK